MQESLLRPGDVIIFKRQEEDSCFLKQCVALCKYSGMRPPLQFNLLSSDTPFVGNMTLKQNILLEAHQDPFPHQFKDAKERVGEALNPFLSGLFERIHSPERKAFEAGLRDKMIVAAIKGILRPTELVFVEWPEKDLEEDVMSILVKCLAWEVSRNGRIVILCTSRIRLFQDLISCVVTKKEDGPFELKRSRNISPSPSRGHLRFNLAS